MTTRLAPRAVAQLEKIHAYIERDQPGAAAATIASILDTIERLAAYPYMGRSGRRKGTRELIHGAFVIVYRIHEDAIEIAAVFHGNQRYE